MSLRLWRKMKACPSPSGYGYLRQQPWPTARLTKRHKRFFKKKSLLYSTELRRSAPKRLFLKISTPLATKTPWSSSLSLPLVASRFGTRFLPRINATLTKESQGVTSGVDGGTGVYTPSTSTSLGIDSAHLFSLLFSGKKSNWKQIKSSLFAMRTRLSRRIWFLDNPAAVPGVLTPYKAKWLHRRKRKAIRSLNIWLGRVPLSFLVKVCQLSTQMNKVGKTWAVVQSLESYGPSVVTKSGWTPHLLPSRQWIQHNKVLLNGFSVKRAWTRFQPGDVVAIHPSFKAFWDNNVANSLFSLNTELQFLCGGYQPCCFSKKNTKTNQTRLYTQKRKFFKKFKNKSTKHINKNLLTSLAFL